MTTETQNTYQRNDLIKAIQERLPHQYPEQSGAMSATIASILIAVEVRDPKLFQEIMEFEMCCEGRQKALDDLAEADKDLI
jgi:hypothetical protein|tara:strand:+ start:123 stop:365 length:243 start_codon:yes stop_codon:yes gene_type:complete